MRGRSQVDVAGFVLAAGLGSRIAKLSQLLPKPLLPMGATTPFARAASALRRAGAARVIANASHRAQEIEAAGRALDVEVVVERDGPRGTAGGLAGARALLDARIVVVWNGDIVSDLDPRMLVERLAKGERTGAVAALAVRGRAGIGEGNVGIGDGGRVVRLRGTSHRALGEERFGAFFTGVHAIARAAVDRAPGRGCLVSDVYLPLLADGATLVACETDARWHDVGDLASYLAANVDLLDGAPSLEGHGARVEEGVVLDRCVVGERAQVEGRGMLREVVVWPGARAVSPLARAVVTGHGVVEVDSP